MNERVSPESQPVYTEINDEQKAVFIGKVREKALCLPRNIDETGSHRTTYLRENGTVDLYVPVVTEAPTDNDLWIGNESVSVYDREEDVIDSRYSMIRTRSYTLHLDENIAEHDEFYKIYDNVYEKWIETNFGARSIKEILDLYNTNARLGIKVFTVERFDKVCALLDSLNESDRL